MAQVRAAGGARSWWERQLAPAGVPDAYADQLPSWWASLTQSPQDMWAADKMGMIRAFGVCQDYQRYVLLRRIYSNRQVLELMTEFWENHLNIPLNGEPSYLFRRSYGETLRTNAFAPGQDIVIPIKNGEGRFVADEKTLDQLEAEDRVIARYVGGNPNGSQRDIAGIRVSDALRDVLVILVPMLVALLLVILFPDLILFLPRLVMPRFV